MRINESEFLYIKENLKEKDLKQKQCREIRRKEQLKYVCGKLKLYFKDYPECNVYLTGSIVRPGSFSDGSDIDIAVENYPGSRLDLFMKLSELIELPVDLIIMERCQFADQIREKGVRVMSFSI
jgi:predicted nucleotidyltransferase